MTPPPLTFTMTPIGFVRHQHSSVPRHHTISTLEATLELLPPFRPGIVDFEPGIDIWVLFGFHESPDFTPSHLKQTPPHRPHPRGLFSTCSPVRPNPIGLSAVTILEVDPEAGTVRVSGVDMKAGTPILDLKPRVTSKEREARPPSER